MFIPASIELQCATDLNRSDRFLVVGIHVERPLCWIA